VATMHYAPQIALVIVKHHPYYSHYCLFRVAHEGLPTMGRPCLAGVDSTGSLPSRLLSSLPLTRLCPLPLSQALCLCLLAKLPTGLCASTSSSPTVICDISVYLSVLLEAQVTRHVRLVLMKVLTELRY